MRVLGKIFSGICAVAFMCSMQAAPAKSSTAKKSSKPKLELELKGISEAKKLYKFLESNEGKIVELSVSIPYEYENFIDRIFFYENKTINKNGEEMCEIKKNKFPDMGDVTSYTTIEKSEEYHKCENEGKHIIEHHIGKNALKSREDIENMDEKWKKANSDIVISGEGYFDGPEGTIEGYYLNNGYIAFEDYQGNGKSQFYSIKVDGKLNSHEFKGIFYVYYKKESNIYGDNSNPNDFPYLQTIGDFNYYCGIECDAGEPNTKAIVLESIDIPKYEAILEYLGK